MNVTSNGTNRCYVPPEVMHCEKDSTSMIFLPKMSKMYNLNLILKQSQTKPN